MDSPDPGDLDTGDLDTGDLDTGDSDPGGLDLEDLYPGDLDSRTLPLAEPAQAISPPAGPVQIICRYLADFHDSGMTKSATWNDALEDLLHFIKKDITGSSNRM